MQGPSTTQGQPTVIRFVIWRIVLIAMAGTLILGLYPAVLRAIAPVGP